MKCSICGKKVTKSQIAHGEAIKTGPGKHVHTNCIDDLSRKQDDAYRRTQ